MAATAAAQLPATRAPEPGATAEAVASSSSTARSRAEGTAPTGAPTGNHSPSWGSGSGAGLATGADGALYVSDDNKGFSYRIAYSK